MASLDLASLLPFGSVTSYLFVLALGVFGMFHFFAVAISEGLASGKLIWLAGKSSFLILIGDTSSNGFFFPLSCYFSGLSG